MTRKVAGGRVDAVRDVVENKVGQARERASDTWDRLEKVFEERVQRALRRLEVPSREDLSTLVDRVDSLNAQLRNLGGAAPRKPAASRKATTGKAPASKKAAASKPAAVSKAPRKAARKAAN